MSIQQKGWQKFSLFLFWFSIVLWIFMLLFQYRVTDIFHAVFMKILGPWVIFGVMLFAPGFLMVSGWSLIRNGRHVAWGRIYSIAGFVFFSAFLLYIGIPLLIRYFEPQTPKNPSTPRPIPAQTGIPVFPGAEGFGTRTPAGRGGKIIHVTSLADSGPGTLREALSDPNPRIILFRVGGTIELEEFLYISHPYLTLAGQTAPGNGICLKNAGLVILTHDVLIQHLRIRPGNEGSIEPENNDAVAILGRHSTADGAYNVVLDHVSTSWGEDETISTWYGAHDITISWCIISEALNRSRHRKKTHSAGLLIGDGSYHVSMHHSLLAHNDFRNPLIISGGTHDFAYNVVYDWGVLPAEIVDFDSNSFLNFIGNTFIPGSSTQAGPNEILVSPEKGIPQIYVEGNLGPHRSNEEENEWSLVGYGYGEEGVAPEIYRSPQKFLTPPIEAMDANQAYRDVLASVGATKPMRDAVDERIVNDVVNRTGRIIDSPGDVGGYPTLSNGIPPRDSDSDGMPDEWEREKGLDPQNEDDAGADHDNDGYTNIEEYLHSLLK